MQSDCEGIMSKGGQMYHPSVDFEETPTTVKIDLNAKRGSGGFVNQQWKGELNKTVFLRLLMSRQEAGCIIGKKGETIKFLRKRSGARIKVSEKSKRERVVSVSGRISTVTRALKLFCREFTRISTEFVTLKDLSSSPNFIYRFLLPTALCGPLIGQRGASIHKMRELTGSLVKITRHQLPDSTDRILFIYGTIAAITTCVKMVCAISEKVKGRSYEIPYTPSTTSPVYPAGPCLTGSTQPVDVGLCASLAARPLDCLRDCQKHCLFPNRTDVSSGSLVHRNINFSKWQETLFPWEKDEGFPWDFSLTSSESVAICPQNATLLSSGLVSEYGLEVRKDMLIANNLIGCIIGRGGMKINEIRKASQAKIRISNDENSWQCFRLISIIGSPMAVESAFCMISARQRTQEAEVNGLF
uniref:KH domain-containing protein n=3 Tax=Mesocestoides corti TaxID=53468 RepID=A0A5K3ENK4_MESCO